MLYEVRFASKIEGLGTTAWAPVEGDDYVVSRREALRRFTTLVAAGKAGDTVDGVVPWLVEVVGENGEVLVGFTTEPGDALIGTLARDAGQEFRAKLRVIEEAA